MARKDSSLITCSIRQAYIYIGEVIKRCYKKQSAGKLSTSDKIDKVVTNRWLGLPIFAVVMFLVYWVAMVGVGAPATDWANDGLFGDGWHLLGIGSAAYNEAAEEYGDAALIVDGYDAYVEENGCAPTGDFIYEVEDEETLEISEETASQEDYQEALATVESYGEEPDPADYGVWVPGIPVLIGNLLEKDNAADWLQGLILDGIVAGVGAVLGFVPQMLVLFLMLAFLEACGYMARIAFVLDRVFRKFGLPICYDGKPIITKDLTEHRRHHISLVFQSYNLIDYLTPLENVKLGGTSDPNLLLSSMGIGEEYWNRSVLQLSGGQQQQVAIARALASDAKVLLADEPTGNLDEATAWDVIDLLKHIAHEEKKCVIVVTHGKELAQAADEVIHIGSIRDVSSKPNF